MLKTLIIVFITLVFSEIKEISVNGLCKSDEFTCTHGKCINIGYICNGRNDCGDNSDESLRKCRRYRHNTRKTSKSRKSLIGRPLNSTKETNHLTRRALAPITEQELKDQDGSMQSYLTQLKLNMAAAPDLESSVRLRLLWLSIQVFQKLTKGEILTTNVTTDGFAKFYNFMQGSLTTLQGGDTDAERYSAIKRILTECSNVQLKFIRIGTGCPKHMSFVPVQKAKMTVGVAFNAYDNDILIEVMWKTFSFVQTMCFPQFINDLNLHHTLETQMESLFLHPIIQQRWHRKTGGFSQMEHIFSTSSMDQRMKHLDSAVRDAYDTTAYKKWLRRPMLI